MTIKALKFHAFLILCLASAAGHAGSLRDFRYDADPALLSELSARVGCEMASQWLAIPAAGAGRFRATLHTMIDESMGRQDRYDRSRAWTSLTEKYLFNAKDIQKICAASSARKVMGSGLEEISAAAPDGLIIFALGGFGSHLGDEGALTTSLRAWKTAQKSLFDTGKVTFERIECSFSFASDQKLCAEDMLAKVRAVLSADAQSSKKKILFWGYSKGGITMLEILARDPGIRARTLAGVTVGAPIQGSQVMDRLVPALDMFVAGTPIPGTSSVMGADTVLKMLQLWVGDSNGGAAAVMSRFPEALEGARSMMTASRAAFLKDELKPGILFRPDGSRIKIFHIAGLLDPDRLNGVPVMTVKNGKIVPKPGTSDKLHAGEAAALVAATNHPLSDTCVALEDAVVPYDPAVAAGLDPALLGVIRVDHLGLRFHRLPGDFKHGVPDHAIVDSVMSTVAASVKRTGG